MRAHSASARRSASSLASCARHSSVVATEWKQRCKKARSERAAISSMLVSSSSIGSPVLFGSRPFAKPSQGLSPSQLAWARRFGRLPKATVPTVSTTAMGIAMGQSFPPTDRQLKASADKCSQVGMPFMAAVSSAQLLPADVISVATFNGCLVEAARHSGMEDQEIADAIHICHGYMSRFMRGVAQQWAKRIVAFMRVTHSLAPLQWMAREMGCELVIRDSQAARIAALQAELHALTGRAAA